MTTPPLATNCIQVTADLSTLYQDMTPYVKDNNYYLSQYLSTHVLSIIVHHSLWQNTLCGELDQSQQCTRRSLNVIPSSLTHVAGLILDPLASTTTINCTYPTNAG
jgi:hypothetical protein